MFSTKDDECEIQFCPSVNDTGRSIMAVDISDLIKGEGRCIVLSVRQVRDVLNYIDEWIIQAE
jgi:hypothetical protein